MHREDISELDRKLREIYAGDSNGDLNNSSEYTEESLEEFIHELELEAKEEEKYRELYEEDKKTTLLYCNEVDFYLDEYLNDDGDLRNCDR